MNDIEALAQLPVAYTTAHRALKHRFQAIHTLPSAAFDSDAHWTQACNRFAEYCHANQQAYQEATDPEVRTWLWRQSHQWDREFAIHALHCHRARQARQLGLSYRTTGHTSGVAALPGAPHSVVQVHP